MEFVNICVKKLPYNLSGDVKKTVSYYLCKSNKMGKVFYGIKIVTNIGNETLSEIVDAISDKKEMVEKLIYYLSENAVDSTCMRDVLEDLSFKEDVCVWQNAKTIE